MKISRRRMMELLGAGGLSTLAAAAWFANDGFFQPVSEARAEDLSTLMEPGPMGDKALGKEDAPVTIIEYASMTCGHCKNFHEKTLPEIKKNYIETGKVRLIFREFPFDPRATAAFMLARCAPDEQYFPMIDVLFQQQSAWTRAEDPVAEFGNIARLAGFTQEQVTGCLQNQEVLDSVMAVQKRAADDYGVNSTPTFFINGKKYEGDMSPKAMSEHIDSLL